MRINVDFSKRVVVRPGDAPWVASPMPGVERQMLDRIGAEVARATSIVRYAPKSYFSAHSHDGGEEFFVLEGTFSDEHADYRAGSYVRNPIGTSHSPHSENGCIIFVKLHQFKADDQRQFAIDTRNSQFEETPQHGVERLVLHRFGPEEVALMRLGPKTQLPVDRGVVGEEVFVLEGSVSDQSGTYPKGTWLRSPAGTPRQYISEEGCLLYVKHSSFAAPNV